jgi:hypothetical protein
MMSWEIFKKFLFPSLVLISSSNSIHAADFFLLRSGGISFNWIYMSGEIEAGDTEKFQEFIERHFQDSKPDPLVLNSPGGNLVEGIKLGALIRDLGLSTYVDQPDDESFQDTDRPYVIHGYRRYDPSTICTSACAYAFLGGVFRSAGDQQVGLHQFYSRKLINGEAANGSFLDFQGIESSTQSLMGFLVWYLYFLGDVDFRVLTAASLTPLDKMFFLSEQQARELNVITVDAFEEFFLEPYGDGIVAASRAKDSLSGYDSTREDNSVSQATLFCRDGNPILMLSSEGYPTYLDTARETASWNLTFRNRPPISFDGPMVYRARNGVLYAELDATDFTRLLDTQLVKVEVEFWLPDRWTGRNAFVRDVSVREVYFLEAAIRFCI